MFRNRANSVSAKANPVSVAVCFLGGFLMLQNPATVVGQLMEIGEPKLVFSMDDFPSISNKSLNCMDVNSDGSQVAFCPHPSCGGAWPYIYQTDGQGGEPMRVGLIVDHNTTQTARFSRDDTKLYYGWRDTETADVDI